MAAIMLSTGLVFDVPSATRDQIVTALAQATVTGSINGKTTTVRSASIIAVADDVNGLRPVYVQPTSFDPPPPA